MANRQRKKRRKQLAAQAAGRRSGRPAPDPARQAMRLIAVAYVVVASLYATSIPLGKGPDESAHIRYVQFLAENHRLPVFDPENPDPDYEFHQPPLYYALSLPCYLLAGGAGETAQHAIRFFTLLISLALVYLTFGLARVLCPGKPWVAPAGAGIVAFLPMQLSVATSIGNDALAEVLAAAALLILAAYLRTAARQRSDAPERPVGAGAMVAAGAAIGLALLTKSVAALLLPVAWLAAALAARHPDGYRWRQLLRDAALATIIVLAIAGWWLVRNRGLYGDLFAQRAFLEAFAGRRPSPQDFMSEYQVTVPEYVGQVIIWTLASATGVFGPVRGNRFAFFPFWVYFATGAIALVGLFGFARYLSRVKLIHYQQEAWIVCGAFAALLIASFVRFNFSFFQAQARYLFPALPAAAVAFCLGLQQLVSERRRTPALAGAVGLLALLALIGLFTWITPQFRLS